MCKWRSQDTERVPFRKDKYCEIEFLLLISFRFLLHFLFVRFVIAPVYSKTRAKSSHKKIGANQNGNDKMCSVAFNFGWFDLEISSNTRTNHITLFFLLFLSFYLFKRIQVFFVSFFFHLGFFIGNAYVAMPLHAKASWNNLLIHYRMENMFGMRLHLM